MIIHHTTKPRVHTLVRHLLLLYTSIVDSSIEYYYITLGGVYDTTHSTRQHGLLSRKQHGLLSRRVVVRGMSLLSVPRARPASRHSVPCPPLRRRIKIPIPPKASRPDDGDSRERSECKIKAQWKRLWRRPGMWQARRLRQPLPPHRTVQGGHSMADEDNQPRIL